MPAVIGIGFAAAAAALARLAGFDRDRSFYPVVLTVIASYYVLFAAMAGGEAGLAIELVVFALFAGVAILGFRMSPWIVVAGLVLHGLFDLARAAFLAGNGVPTWWPSFCSGYDLSAALALAAILVFAGKAEANRPCGRCPCGSRGADGPRSGAAVGSWHRL